MKVTKIKNSKIKKNSSKKWLTRHLSDPLVHKAKMDGYKSRAAYKLIEIDKKYHIFKNTKSAMDLGAAPGSWSQVMANNGIKVTAIDILDFDLAHENITRIVADINSFELDNLIEAKEFDLIVSDMAANTTGNKDADVLKTLSLVELAVSFLGDRLKQNGSFVTKIFQGSGIDVLIKDLQKKFKKVTLFKPSSSRKESKEIYLVCLNKKD